MLAIYFLPVFKSMFAISAGAAYLIDEATKQAKQQAETYA